MSIYNLLNNEQTVQMIFNVNFACYFHSSEWSKPLMHSMNVLYTHGDTF